MMNDAVVHLNEGGAEIRKYHSVNNEWYASKERKIHPTIIFCLILVKKRI